ncbi:hypothetical protein DICVIV_13462 [Dictyocaulus viviparus]|uniref:Neurotransmitter-gated ion-channel transmembrane region n=1 Tax=Dictyocaulus viviparus TaxID=29172 RepID=A0A0D8X7P8_DICVI|nr:hypothetical protein DICVIV_13462 [Dictyocaulus viviparus]
MVIRNEERSPDHQHLNWENMSRSKPITNNEIREVGDLILIDVTLYKNQIYRRNGAFDELNIQLNFRRGQYKILLMFFLPSILFMVVSWLSLILGPMAITRSVLIIGSMLLLLTHYYANMAGLPETTGITSIDLWKIFSLLFVVGILIELVLVTCMASMGRSTKFTRCCHQRKTRGKYELEPLYEELNDLRTRGTRSTCGCCRYSALFMDCLALWISAAVFVLFMLTLYTRGSLLVKWFNDVNPSNLSL